MADTYLALAKKILRAHGRPMSAQEIIDASKKYGMLPEHLHGNTMQKTLQARLSEDIIEQRFRSPFYRVSSGIFFLRECVEDMSIDDQYKKEFHALRRQASPQKQRVLCLPKSAIKLPPGLHKCAGDMASCFASNEGTYRRKDEADKDDRIVQAITFTMVMMDSSILLHRVGKFSEFYRFSEGYTIGFRCNIGEFDIDLMNDDMIGLKRNTSRIVFRNMHFPERTITDIELISKMSVLGLLYDGNHSVVFVVKFSSWNENIQPKIRRSLALNQAKWCKLDEVISYDIDSWSKAIVDSELWG